MKSLTNPTLPPTDYSNNIHHTPSKSHLSIKPRIQVIKPSYICKYHS